MPTVVDLPAPLGPRSPKISRGRTSRLRPSSAMVWCVDLVFAFGRGPAAPNPRPAPATGGGDVKTLRSALARMPTVIAIRIISGGRPSARGVTAKNHLTGYHVHAVTFNGQMDGYL